MLQCPEPKTDGGRPVTRRVDRAFMEMGSFFVRRENANDTI